MRGPSCGVGEKMDFTRLWLLDELWRNFDTDFQEFYHRVLQKELNLSNAMNAFKVKQALKEVVHAYKKETVDSFESNILFNSPEKRCAYILKHCSCFTSAAARHLHQLLQENPYLFHDAIYRGKVKVCCLGGGPGTDAVAVAIVINVLNNCIRSPRKKKLCLTINIVDLNEDWKTTAGKVMETLQETRKFCDSQTMTVNFKFFKADLTEQWEKPLKKVLSRADIVTMVYFVSAVNGSRVKDKCPLMLQNIMSGLKTGSLLFFLDSAKDLHYDRMQAVTKLVRNMDLIYGPRLQEFHTLSLTSIKKFLELYPGDFSVHMCLTNCFVSSAGWVKNVRFHSYSSGDDWFRNDGEHPIERKRKQYDPFIPNVPIESFDNVESLNGGKKIKGKNSKKKLMAYNTKKQQRFREKLNMMFGRMYLNYFAHSDLDDFEECFSEADDWLCCDVKMLCPTKSKPKRILAWPEEREFIQFSKKF